MYIINLVTLKLYNTGYDTIGLKPYKSVDHMFPFPEV